MWRFCTPGWGRGWRWWYYATGLPGWMRWGRFPYSYPPYPPYPARPEDELEMLEELKSVLEEELEDVRKRIDELKRELGKA